MKVYTTAYFFFFLLFSIKVNAQQDSMQVALNKQQFMQGDSLTAEVILVNGEPSKAQTIQLWIENIETGRQWKFRFPLMDGYLSASLKIDDQIPNGKYAFNFLLQKDFFALDGKILNERYKDKSLNYLVVAKNKQSIIGDVPVQPDGAFSARRFLFRDTAFFIFTPIKRNRENDLNIRIKTPLDSAFVPAATVTKIIQVGKVDTTSITTTQAPQPYTFKLTKKDFNIVLSEVVVTAKAKKLVEQFEKDNVSGLFSGNDAIVFDGLSNDDIANSVDIFSYLQSHVAGLRSETNSETGLPVLSWRNSPTEIFINEIRATDFSPFDINPADVAMIKVFRPGMALGSGSGAGGAVAIYTRKGIYQKQDNRKYSFYIRGYNGLDERWK